MPIPLNSILKGIEDAAKGFADAAKNESNSRDHIIRITSPVDGKVSKSKVEEDDYIDKADTLIIIKSESGGREYTLKAPRDGKVIDVNTYKGEWVGKDELLIKLDDRF